MTSGRAPVSGLRRGQRYRSGETSWVYGELKLTPAKRYGAQAGDLISWHTFLANIAFKSIRHYLNEPDCLEGACLIVITVSIVPECNLVINVFFCFFLSNVTRQKCDAICTDACPSFVGHWAVRTDIYSSFYVKRNIMFTFIQGINRKAVCCSYGKIH